MYDRIISTVKVIFHVVNFLVPDPRATVSLFTLLVHIFPENITCKSVKAKDTLIMRPHVLFRECWIEISMRGIQQ